MRIAYVHQYFTSLSGAGGTRSYEMARRLSERGHEVHIVTTDVEAQRLKLSWRQEEMEGFWVHRLAIPYRNNMGFLSRMLAFLTFAAVTPSKVTKLGADAVLATSTPLTVAVPMMWARIRSRTPTVFEVRDLWPELPVALGVLKNPCLIAIARYLERAAYAFADEIVALSPGMADGVRRVRPSASVTVIPNSCDFDLFQAGERAGDSLREELGLQPGQPLVAYVGTLGRLNGVSYLADVALEMLNVRPEVQFLVVGGGAERRSFEERCRKLGVLGRNVRVLPPVPKRDVPRILSAATVCVSLFLSLPEMEANSANKFFDALAAGRPVAINYGGWQAELLAKYGAGLRLSRDSRIAAAQLAHLLEDSEGLQAYRDGASRLAERFSRDGLALDLEAAIIRAVAAKACRRLPRLNRGSRP